MGQLSLFCNGASGSSKVNVKLPVNGVSSGDVIYQLLDFFSLFKDRGITPEVSVVGRDVAKALVALAIVGIVYKDFDSAF